MIPAAMRSATFHRASAPYPWFTVPGGTGSPEPRFQLFLAGSASGVTVTVGGLTIRFTVRTAPFQVPKRALGAMGVPPYCQSLLRLLGSLVMSVMNSDGHIGRSDKSVPA